MGCALLKEIVLKIYSPYMMSKQVSTAPVFTQDCCSPRPPELPQVSPFHSLHEEMLKHNSQHTLGQDPSQDGPMKP